MGTSSRGPTGEVPDTARHRALSAASRVRMLDLLRRVDGGLTAAEVAEATGLHPSTVRAHLEQLAASGLAARGPGTHTGPTGMAVPGGDRAGRGSYRLRPTDAGGAQVLDLAPASGGFVEAVLPQRGTYPFLTHAMSDADLGARGAIRADP